MPERARTSLTGSPVTMAEMTGHDRRNTHEGIQPSTRHVIADSLVRLRAEYGLSVLLVEQDLELASRVVQRIAVFERGTIKHESPTAELGLAQLAVLVGVG